MADMQALFDAAVEPPSPHCTFIFAPEKFKSRGAYGKWCRGVPQINGRCHHHGGGFKQPPAEPDWRVTAERLLALPILPLTPSHPSVERLWMHRHVLEII